MNTTQSILETTKQLVRVSPEDEVFDTEIILAINTVFSDLNQLGVGPDVVFQIEGKEEQWDAFTDGNNALNAVKSYMGNRVRLLFDPPTTSFGILALEKQIKEHEWRLMEAAEQARQPATSASLLSSVTLASLATPSNPVTPVT